MSQIIGFTNKFYTLWSHTTKEEFITDAYGKHHLSSVTDCFTYIKNISFDRSKVEELYPNTPINMDLRGVNYYETTRPSVYLPKDYLWFGKYKGTKIDEILEKDIQYCVWVSKNAYSADTREYILNHELYIQHIKKQEEEANRRINESEVLQVNQEIELIFDSNLYNSWFSDNGEIEYFDSDYELGYKADRGYIEARYNDIKVLVISKGVKYVGGMYPYEMGFVNGKFQRTRNKTIKITVDEVIETKLNDNNEITQVITIK